MAGRIRAILVGDGASRCIGWALLFSLSPGEAAEGLGRGLTCFDIYLRRIVWAARWGRDRRQKQESGVCCCHVDEGGPQCGVGWGGNQGSDSGLILQDEPMG